MALASTLDDQAMLSMDAQDSRHTTSFFADRDLNTDLDHDTVQVLPLPSHPPIRQDWEAYRAIFTQLYRTESRSLKEAMSVMAAQYSFKATPRMFKRRVTEWKLNKNYKSSERKAVARIVERYKNYGDPIPPIMLRGQPVKMHRIQRHCKIGQPVRGPFAAAESLDSSALENHTGQIEAGGLTIGYTKEIYLMDGMRVTTDNLQKGAAQVAIPLRQLSSPHDLKHAELIVLQTNIFYEWFAQSRNTLIMKRNTGPKCRAEAQTVTILNPDEFSNQINVAFLLLKSGQFRVGWRLLHKTMDYIRPMLASKDPHILINFLRMAWSWEEIMPLDFYRVIWSQISEMASIVLGKNDPHSKIFLAITHLKSKRHIYEITARLILSILERTLGPYEIETLEAKANNVAILLASGDLSGAECLQKTLISNSEKLRDKCIQKQEVPFRTYGLAYILKLKGDFIMAKKVFRDALRLGRVASGDRFPILADIYCIEGLVSVLAENEFVEGESLLQEALENCLKNEHWGRNDWRTGYVLGLLEKFLKKHKKFHEAEILRLEYPEAF